MYYASDGNLRKFLLKIIKMSWSYKLNKLYAIINGLNGIHQQNLIHCDIHDGNILNKDNKTYIKLYY